jgi:hypothetical protein
MCDDEAAHLTAARKQRERSEEPETSYTLQRHHSRDTLSPTRPYLPQFSLLPTSPFKYEPINGLTHG